MTERLFFMGAEAPRVPQDKLDRLREYGACVVGDAMSGFNAMDGRVQRLAPGECVCGCAVTVRLRPGDNLMLHKAIETARSGDVLVLDTAGSVRCAVIGSMMCEAAFAKGIGGLVIDGAVRDVEDLRAHGYPVFAAAVVPNAADSAGPGQLNRPISCGGAPVLPGDIIVADDNGVSVVPQDCLDWVLERCAARVLAEARRTAEIRAGKTTSDAVLARLDAAGYGQ